MFLLTVQHSVSLSGKVYNYLNLADMRRKMRFLSTFMPQICYCISIGGNFPFKFLRHQEELWSMFRASLTLSLLRASPLTSKICKCPLALTGVKGLTVKIFSLKFSCVDKVQNNYYYQLNITKVAL